MQRYLSIDLLRGLAIVLMIQVHFVENLSPREPSSAWLYDASTLLGSFPAPMFSFVSGLSCCLWIRKQEAARQRDDEITKITLRRGIFLFVLGIAFNFFIWLPEETFNWDILTLIGTSFLFLAFARKLPPAVLGLISLVVFLLSPVMRVVGDYSAYWKDQTYSYDFTFRDVLFGYFANGYFPVYPWIIFPIMGYLSGDLIFPRRQATLVIPWRLCALGAGLLALAGLVLAAGKHLPSFVAQRYATGLSEFPASTEYVLAMLGFLLLFQVFLHRWSDSTDEVAAPGRFQKLLQRYSLFSLTVYVLHHLVILWPLWAYGAWKGHEDATHYWHRALNTPSAFGLAVAFLLACSLVLLVLERNRTYSLEALLRWICD